MHAIIEYTVCRVFVVRKNILSVRHVSVAKLNLSAIQTVCKGIGSRSYTRKLTYNAIFVTYGIMTHDIDSAISFEATADQLTLGENH